MTDKYLPTVAFCTWGASLIEQDLLKKIIEVFKLKLIGLKVEIKIIDLKTTEYDERHDTCIVFGDTAERYIKAGCLTCPSLKSMTSSNPDLKQVNSNKIKTMNVLTEAAKQLFEVELGRKEIHVETPTGVTVGPKCTDIIITPEEAKHLKDIKDLLGGGTMVITKGDIKIEVKNEQ